MAVVRIENFGGEQPSVSPRALPVDAAQENRNLLLATREFRPVSQDATVAECPAGTQTLHRFARNPDGTFNSDTSTGWIASVQERSYVKGQINDERTERTYYTVDDGSARPRVVDVNGADRLLGVPRPTKPTVTLNAAPQLTREDANNFLFGNVTHRLRLAVTANAVNPAHNEPASRIVGGVPLAGPYTVHGLLTHNAPDVVGVGAQNLFWLLHGRLSAAAATMAGVDTTQIRARLKNAPSPEHSEYLVPIGLLPFRRGFDRPGLVAAFQTVEHPPGSGALTGTALFSASQAEDLADRVIAQFDPNLIAKTERDRLDAIATEFSQLLAALNADALLPAQDRQTWVGVTQRISQLQSEADSLSQEVERKMAAAWRRLTDSVQFFSDFIDAQGGVSGLGMQTTERLVEYRFYIVTMVTDWGEESEPSPVSDMVELDQNDFITISRPSLSSGDPYAQRNVTKWRVYRSNSGSTSSAFQFVDEIAITTASYADRKKGAELGEICPTITWAEPPYRMDGQFAGFPKPAVGSNPFLRGLVGMPNGIMAGFFDNTVAFCEPFVPYAWPVEYQIVTEFPIVGLGVFGQTLFVGTTANPYFIYGADSASMTAQKLDSNQACASRRSIATVQGGVLYASPDGLCVADPNGVTVVSGALYTREDWQKLQPSTMFAIEHENIYYLFYEGAGGGCLTFDLASKKLGRIDLTATAAFVDRVNDTLFVSTGETIRAVFGAPTRRAGKWRSGLFTLPAQASLAWLKVYGDQSAHAPVTVRWYGDGALRHTLTVTDLQPVRLPPGRWLEHEVEVESTSRITRLVLASSTVELQSL